MIRDNIIKDKEYKGKIDVILEGIEQLVAEDEC